jgi:hypothetical protein
MEIGEMEMNRTLMARGLATLALMLVFTASAVADRLPSVRSNGQKSSGSRIDMTVPFLNHGGNAFQGYSVAPLIKSSPIVSDKIDPGAKPVYNLPFYGGKQAFGSGSNGAVLRTSVPVRKLP